MFDFNTEIFLLLSRIRYDLFTRVLLHNDKNKHLLLRIAFPAKSV